MRPGKIDVKTNDDYRATPGRFRLLQVPVRRYLMIDGRGDPNTAPEYRTALETLYPLAYTLKFLSKHDLDRDYVVPPLQGLWWAEDMDVFTGARDKSVWEWTMMIHAPEWITGEMFEAAAARVTAKNPGLPVGRLRLETLEEGRCVQTLHIGPYDDEGEVLAAMHHDFIPSHGLRMRGKHHEIYLSDPRRSAPERLRTILRQPVTPEIGGAATGTAAGYTAQHG